MRSGQQFLGIHFIYLFIKLFIVNIPVDCSHVSKKYKKRGKSLATGKFHLLVVVANILFALWTQNTSGSTHFSFDLLSAFLDTNDNDQSESFIFTLVSCFWTWRSKQKVCKGVNRKFWCLSINDNFDNVFERYFLAGASILC